MAIEQKKAESLVPPTLRFFRSVSRAVCTLYIHADSHKRAQPKAHLAFAYHHLHELNATPSPRHGYRRRLALAGIQLRSDHDTDIGGQQFKKGGTDMVDIFLLLAFALFVKLADSHFGGGGPRCV